LTISVNVWFGFFPSGEPPYFGRDVIFF
jgi:hypothetical protein